MVLGTPAEPGTYELNVSLVQRLGCWFDVDGPGHALTGEVSVALHADGHRGEVAPDVEPNIGGPEAPPPDLLERAVEEELPGVDEMVAELGDAPELWRAGRFWEALNERVSRLDGPEFFTFKRTENALYFTFVVLSPLHENFRAALRGWLRRPRPSTLLARPDPAAVDVRWFQSYAAGGSVPGPLRRWTYALHVAMIWDLARERLGPELDSLQEPRLGDPLSIKHRGLRISHDLANSALELSTIAEGMPHERLASAHVIELGGGYGRVAWAMLSLHRGVRYVVVDIPPSLAVAQRYLTETLPDRSVFRFRRFEDPDEVIDEIVNAEMVFLTPNQLAMLPPLGVDLWVNISSLHEMRREQIAAHLEQAGRHVAGWAYTKQWIVSLNMADEVVLEQDDYPYPTHWQRLIERRHPAQPGYFEALFSTTSVAQQSAVARSAPRGQAASDLVIAGSASTPQA
jgi:putative sugar O-methyltransferase